MSLLAVSVIATACGDASLPMSPITEALIAFRASDRQAFNTARQKAEAARKTARTAAQMRCRFNLWLGEEYRKRTELEPIRKLDRDSLFAREEDERLVYALNVLSLQSLTNGTDQDWFEDVMRENHTCPPETDKDRAEISAMELLERQLERSQRKVAGDWIAAKKQEYGEEKYQASMKAAANRLTNSGYPTKWPVKVILSDRDMAQGTFNDPNATFK